MSEASEAVLAAADVSRESRAAIEAYATLLLKWNASINLVGPVSEAELWERHIADGLQLLPYLKETDRAVVDLGSGAGVPGLVLALGARDRPGFKVHLVESNRKKAAFLSEVVRITGAPAIVHNQRIEAGALPEADVVTARALAPLPKLLELAYPLLSRGARGLFHKGRGVNAELTDSGKYWRLRSISHRSALGEGGCILEVLEIAHA